MKLVLCMMAEEEAVEYHGIYSFGKQQKNHR